MQIYLARNNQQAGPYTLEQINQMLASQQVLLTDLAWHQGMNEWKALGELTQGKLIYQPEGSTNTPNTNAPFENTSSSQSQTTQSTLHAQNQNKSKTELASIGARAYAKIIDMLLWLPALLIPALLLDPSKGPEILALQEKINNNPGSDEIMQIQTEALNMFFADTWLPMLIYIFAMLALQAYLMVKSGQSVGKKLAKIKIVDAKTDQSVGLTRIFLIRSFIFVILTLLVFPFVTIIDYVLAIGEKRQTLHDKLAQTKVIKQ